MTNYKPSLMIGIATAVGLIGVFSLMQLGHINTAQGQVIQQPSEVIVANDLKSPVPTTSVGCTPENIQHWDKIIYSPKIDLYKPGDIQPAIRNQWTYEIIKQYDPSSLDTSLNEQVASILASNGYYFTGAEHSHVLVVAGYIQIVNVDYAITCSTTSPTSLITGTGK